MTQQTFHQTYENITEYVKDIHFDPTVWYVSVTVQKETTSEELLRIIRSQLPTALEKNELHALMKYQLREIIKLLHNFARQQHVDAQKVGNDVFVVMRFDSKKLSRASKDDVEDLCIFSTFNVPEVIDTQLSLSNVPDLTYIFSADTVESADPDMVDAYVITIDPEYANCYAGQTIDLENQVWSERNIYSKPEEDRYIERVAMNSQNEISHGTGSDKVQRTYNSGLFLFARHQVERIQRELNPKVISIFFSQRFATMQKELRAMVLDVFLTENIHFEIVSSDSFDDTQSTSLKKSQNRVHSMSHPPKNSKKISDLHEVNKLMRMGNINKVILSTELDETGYVTPDSKTYTYPVKNSKKVLSIRPWLIKSALDISAQVTVNHDTQMSSEIVGIPRY